MNTKTLFIRRLLMLLFISIIAVSSLISQVPYGMKYQAVVRDTWGRIIENKTVGVEIKILQYTEDGSAVFIEEHQKTTNEYGLIYLVIGSISQQEFINIDWSKGPYYVEIGIDIDGGVNYEQYGTSELLSVPYALYALHAQTADISIDSLIGEAGSGFIANVADYGAVGDGSTNDTEAFNKAFTENTDVFIPSSDNTYIVSNLTIPSEKRIWFEHGAILEVFGLISGNETEIIAGDYQIFTSGSVIDGSWKGGIAYDSWLGNNQQIPGMNAMITSADTTRWGTQIPVLDSAYSEAWDESLEVATRNSIYDKIQSLELSGGSSFIANVVDDYAAIGDGSTDNAQAFENAFAENNDIFIPTAEDNYLISSLNIPSGKRLWFERGAMIDVSGNVSGDTTEIIAGDYQIFTSSSSLSGTWKGGIVYDSWFGNNQQIPGMNAMITSADTTRWGTQIPVLDSAYSEAWDESLEVATRNSIYDKIQSLELSGGSSFIANVVDDYAAIGDGSTDNAEAFDNAFSENNDVFVPTAEDNYLISSLNIPSGKRLWFERGAMIDVSGNVSGDTTEIIAGDYQIFTSSSSLSGTWKGGIAYDSWFGNNQQIPGMKAMITSADTTRWGTQIPVLDSAYSEAWDESLEVATRNSIYDKIQSLELSGGSSFIANVVVDYTAIGDGSTDNAQAFENAFIENNDVFVPTAEDNYVISNLNIPSGKRLWFERGAIIDVTGSLSGDTTEIIAGDYQLFTGNSTLTGTWKSGIAFDCWLGNNCAIPGIKAMVTSADTTRWGTQIPVLDSAYSEEWDESIEVATRNAIYDKIQSLELSGGSSFIANVVDDYAAIGDGTTDNAQAFSNSFIENNDVFVPFAEENYLISTLSIPHGKRLWFERGAKIDVTGTLAGDTTEIIAGDYQIFTSTSELTGTWKGGIAYDSWFGNNQQIPGMRAMITPADTARWAIDTYGSGSFIANVIDYGAVSDGTTDNTEAFEEAFEENDDLFIPGGDSTYLISNFTIPKGKRIWFETNAKIDVTGLLVGDSTEIMAGDQELFTATSTLNGTWKGGISYNSWSGKNEQIPGMVSMVSPADTTRWGTDLFGSGSFIANVIDYGAEGDGSTDDSTAFFQALSENNDIFVPNSGEAYKITKLTIPEGKRVWFETGAILDVKNELIFKGEISAGQHQIFTIESAGKIVAEDAKYDKSYPEWFGAKGTGNQADATINRKAFQAVINHFRRAIYVPGRKYIIDSTIRIEPNTNMEFRAFNHDYNNDGQDKRQGVLEPSDDMTEPVLFIYKGAFALKDISIYIPNYAERGGSISDAYTGWAVEAEFDEKAPNPIYNRVRSYIDGLNIIQQMTGPATNGPGYRFNGIKLDVREYSETGYESAEYFSHYDNIFIVGADTALYISGDSQDLGHVNSCFFDSFHSDKSIHALVIDEMARGHNFTNMHHQIDYRSPFQDWMNNKYVEIKGFANKVQLSFDDGVPNMDSAIQFTWVPGSLGCKYNTITGGGKNITTWKGPFTGTYKQSNKSGDWIDYTNVGQEMIKFSNPSTNGEVGIHIKGVSRFEDIMSLSSYTSNPILITRQKTEAYNTKRPIIDLIAEATQGNMTNSFGPGIIAKIKDNGVDSDQTIGGLYFTRDGADNEGKFKIYNGTNGNELRYSIDKNGVHTMSDVLKLTPRTSAPPNPTEGMMYVSSSNHHIYCYLGGVWKQLD